MRERAERWHQNPPKDAERARRLAPYAAAAREVQGQRGGDAFRWLVEEFRVSIFAQAVGTAEPVSEVKLDRALAALRTGVGSAPPSHHARPVLKTAAPIRVTPVGAKAKPLKGLKSLDALWGRKR